MAKKTRVSKKPKEAGNRVLRRLIRKWDRWEHHGGDYPDHEANLAAKVLAEIVVGGADR